VSAYELFPIRTALFKDIQDLQAVLPEKQIGVKYEKE
jgi:hypothetical protein